MAHISIDDVTVCFQKLAKDSSQYNCIFDEPFFAYLKELHEQYGASITCYAFLQDGDFEIGKMPNKYSSDFKSNSDWLKIGFHGIAPSSHKPTNVNYQTFTESFRRFNSEVKRFASESSIASILRLDYYYATPGEVEFLAGNGLSTLLSADDDRRSYYLPFKKNKQLIEMNSIQHDGLKYLRTNIRIENIDIPYVNILRNRDRDTLVVFTHEWKLDRMNKCKLNRTLKILEEQDYKFISE